MKSIAPIGARIGAIFELQRCVAKFFDVGVGLAHDELHIGAALIGVEICLEVVEHPFGDVRGLEDLALDTAAERLLTAPNLVSQQLRDGRLDGLVFGGGTVLKIVFMLV